MIEILRQCLGKVVTIIYGEQCTGGVLREVDAEKGVVAVDQSSEDRVWIALEAVRAVRLTRWDNEKEER